MARARILLADEHTLVAEAFQRLLEPQYEVIGIVADGRSLLNIAQQLKPDIAVIDISMPLLNGLDAGRQIKQFLPQVKLIFLTMNDDPDLANEAQRLGSSGYKVHGHVDIGYYAFLPGLAAPFNKSWLTHTPKSIPERAGLGLRLALA